MEAETEPPADTASKPPLLMLYWALRLPNVNTIKLIAIILILDIAVQKYTLLTIITNKLDGF
jgi:hypothetical protein